MQNLCTEVCKLGALLEVEVTYRRCTFHHAGVVVVHAVDIGPDLDLLGIHCRADQCCGIVTATTLEIVVATLVVHTDEALCDIYTAFLVSIEQWQQVLADIFQIGLAIDCKTHEVESIQQLHVDTLLLHEECNHIGRDDLALGYNLLLKIVAQLLLSEVAQMCKHLIYLGGSCSLALLGLVELADCLHVLCLQECRVLACTVHIAITQIVCKLDE